MNTLKLAISSSTETDTVPGLCVVEVDHLLLDEIHKLQKAVTDAGAYSISTWDYAPRWHAWNTDDEDEPGEVVRVDAPTMHVSSDEVWWTAFLGHCDVKLETENVYIEELTL